MNKFPLTGPMFDVMLRSFCPDDINMLMQVVDFGSYAAFLVVKGHWCCCFQSQGKESNSRS